VVLQLRVDQAWGYAAVAGAIHDLAGAYYGAGNLPLVPATVVNGHPPDKKGWAVNFGGQVNLQGGDHAGAGFQYSQGAAGYGSATGQSWAYLKPGTSAGWSVATPDAVFIGGSDLELTTVWNVIAYYEHIWNPRWRTSIYGGYVNVSFNSTAKTFIIPAAAAAACGVGSGLGNPFSNVTLLAGNSCDPNWSFYQIGTRTQWNPHPLLDIGLEV